MKITTIVSNETPLEAGFFFDVFLSEKDGDGIGIIRIFCDKNFDGKSSNSVTVFSNHEPFGKMPASMYKFTDYTRGLFVGFSCIGTFMLSGMRSDNMTVGEFVSYFNDVMSRYRIELPVYQIVEWEGIDIYKGMLPMYTNDYTYTGINSYHHSHHLGRNTPKVESRYNYRIGVELEVEARSQEIKSNISRWKSNWFHMERDGSLNDGGIEFITIPLRAEDAKSVSTWSELADRLRPDCISWGSPRCGLHVHIGKEILGDDEQSTLGKLLFLYHHIVKDEPYNTNVFGRKNGYHAPDGKTQVGEIASMAGRSLLRKKKAQLLLIDSMVSKSYSERYFDINITNNNTIEFRLGKSTTKVERIVSVVEYCEMMCRYAKDTRWDKLSSRGFLSYITKNVDKNSPLLKYIKGHEE